MTYCKNCGNHPIQNESWGFCGDRCYREYKQNNPKEMAIRSQIRYIVLLFIIIFFVVAISQSDTNNNTTNNSQQQSTQSNTESNKNVIQPRESNQNSSTKTDSNVIDSTNVVTDTSNDYYVNASANNYVHFYSSPDLNTVRNSYFDSREKVTALKIENGFIYVDFINSEDQHSKGWLSLNDVTKVNLN